MSIPMAVIALDLGHVPFFLLGNNINTCGRGVAITILSPSSAAPGTSMIVLVLFWVSGRSLLSGKWLFSTRCVNRGGVGRFILSEVPFLLLRRPVPPETPWVHIAGAGRWLEHRLYLRVDGFLHGLFPGVQVLASDIYLGPDKRFQAFQEALDHDLLVWSWIRIILSEDWL